MTNYKNQIEALLFASGRFMDVNTLLSLTGASNKQVLINNINKLKQEYESRESPLMVVEEKDGWKLTVREHYLPLVRKIVSETELPKTILETLAVVAWRAPVLQSEVVNLRHNKAYEHISELTELGFIRKDPEGRSYRLSLTEKFFEYFDVDGTKNIRDMFKKVAEPDLTQDFQELEMPDWYNQGEKFLDEEKPAISNEEEFSKVDSNIEDDSEEEYSEL